MAYSAGNHVTVPASGSSAGIDTTGADILFFALGRHTGVGLAAISDSYSNTWTARTEYGGTIEGLTVYYAKNPTVGTGHTFSVGSNTFARGCVAAFSGADTSAPYDVENGNGVSFPTSPSTIQPGTLTASQNDSLYITALGTAPNGGPNGYTVDSSFTITDTVDAIDGTSCGCGLAYKIVAGTPSAENPTWSIAVTNNFGTGTTINTWKPAAGGGGGGAAESVFVPQIITFG